MDLAPLPMLLPSLPWNTLEIVVTVVAALGTILITYGIFLGSEKKQDVVIMIGALSLLIYALYIGNLLFTIAMSGLAAATCVEFIEILLGVHKDFGADKKK